MPFQYLCHKLSPKEIKPQKLKIRKEILQTLNDFQRQLGDIQWKRPYLKFPMEELKPLSEILKGSSNPNSNGYLKDTGRHMLVQVEYTIQKQQMHYINYDQTWKTCTLPTKLTPTAVLRQNGPLLWLHLPVLPLKVLNLYFEAVTCLIQNIQMESR